MSNDLGVQLLSHNYDNAVNTATVKDTQSYADRCKHFWEYMKIIALGVIICGCVSGLWSFLTHVESITPRPNSTTHGVASYNGITCAPARASLHSAAQSYCNTIARNMANNATSNIEWQCATNTDYSDSNIIHSFPGLAKLFIVFVASVCAASYFTIVHDIALLTKVKNGTMDEINFWPSTKFNNFPSQKVFYEYIITKLESSCDNICDEWTICCPFLSFIWILFAVLSLCITGALGWIDSFYMLFIYPFLHCSPYCCSGCVELSSTWIGITRSVAIIVANIFLLVGMSGVANPIANTLDDDACSCSCEYLLDVADVLAISSVVIILTINNLLFIHSWVQEATHQQWYFYLIRYSLPTRFAYAVQPKNPTADITEINIGQRIKLQVDEDLKDNTDLMLYKHNKVEEDQVAINCRCSALYMTVLEILIFMLIGLVAGLPSVKTRGYSESIAIICSVIGWTVFSMIVMGSCWVYCKNATKMKFSGRFFASVFVFAVPMNMPTYIALLSKK